MSKAATCTHHHQPISRSDIGIQDPLTPVNRYPNGPQDPSHLVCSHPRAQHRPDHLGIRVIRKDRQVSRIEGDVLLKTPILMVQMVCALDAVLLCPSQAEFALSAHATREPDANEAADA